MRFHHSIAAASAAVALAAGSASAATGDSPCAPLPTAVDQYAAMQGRPPAERTGQVVAVDIDLVASAEFALGADGKLSYGMAFNDLTEGWSWQPQTRPEVEDYYRWKFLPLQSRLEAGASYVQEEKIGEPQQTRVERRYDYFLAFDNPYDFYSRGDAGFTASVAPGRPARLVALASLGEPAVSESTTFWKAVHARPVDFTLKKRYLVGKLQALIACDARSGEELARIVPRGQR